MNTSKVIAIIIALSLADFGTTILCTRWLGSSLTYALFAVPMLLGLFMQWRRFKADAAKAEPQMSLSDEERKKLMPENMAGTGAWFLVTVLLLIPGLVTAGIAFIIMLTPVNIMLTPVNQIIRRWFFDKASEVMAARDAAQAANEPMSDQLPAS
ncbi:MAG: FxsA family protein [Abitibacteriaceae bacterium]|nr:FxsA family protein [Abditibacteriaceae bacterium]MBV9864820.1 FxsA family protein [Abditibacteriaceae bacterium]